jgi:hypothetical protein
LFGTFICSSIFYGVCPNIPEDSENFMQSRQSFILLVTLLLLMTLLAGLSQSIPQKQTATPIAQVENVRDYRSAIMQGGPDYAVNGGLLYVGHPGYWVEIPLPEEVIASAVDVIVAPAVDAGLAHETIYIGAANELAIYRTDDRGETWLRGQLTHDIVHKGIVGGVTDLAVDPVQRLVYVGTDTAGLFRVRDAENELKSSAQLLLREPVLQVVTDRQGSGFTLIRTEWHLYRGEDFGLNWVMVDLALTVPTALAMIDSTKISHSEDEQSAVVLLGTVDDGVLRSEDGKTWTSLNSGLVTTPAGRLYVDALAVDPIQRGVAYVAVSLLRGNHYVQHAPDQVAYTRDGGATWTNLEKAILSEHVTELLPVSGHLAAVYALTTSNRTPQALGNAPSGAIPALASNSQPEQSGSGRSVAWVAAGLAALALVFALITDLLSQPEVPISSQRVLEPRPARRNRWS